MSNKNLLRCKFLYQIYTNTPSFNKAYGYYIDSILIDGKVHCLITEDDTGKTVVTPYGNVEFIVEEKTTEEEIKEEEQPKEWQSPFTPKLYTQWSIWMDLLNKLKAR